MSHIYVACLCFNQVKHVYATLLREKYSTQLSLSRNMFDGFGGLKVLLYLLLLHCEIILSQ